MSKIDPPYNFSRYKGVVFDLDGTLVDLGVDWQSLKGELGHYCLSKKDRDIDFSSMDKGLSEARKLFGESFYLDLLGLISNREMQAENYQLNEELISYINSKVLNKIAIHSMNTGKCVKNFTSQYLEVEPDYLIYKESRIEPKPTDKDLKHLLSLWGFSNKEIILVGNSENDRLSAERAGVDFFLVDHFAK